MKNIFPIIEVFAIRSIFDSYPMIIKTGIPRNKHNKLYRKIWKIQIEHV